MNLINITLVSLPLATNLETITATYNATRHTEATCTFLPTELLVIRICILLLIVYILWFIIRWALFTNSTVSLGTRPTRLLNKCLIPMLAFGRSGTRLYFPLCMVMVNSGGGTI